jgi:hypothetical protein
MITGYKHRDGTGGVDKCLLPDIPLSQEAPDGECCYIALGRNSRAVYEKAMAAHVKKVRETYAKGDVARYAQLLFTVFKSL